MEYNCMTCSKRGNNIEERITGQTKYLAKGCFMFRTCPKPKDVFWTSPLRPEEGGGQTKETLEEWQTNSKIVIFSDRVEVEKLRGESWW